MAYIDDLIEQGGQLFDKRGQLLSLWQTIADNFYPERADFTTVRNLGSDFASNLTTSYPILARRDLGNGIGAMLRPTSKSWFHLRTAEYDKLDRDGKAWLEFAEERMRRAMRRRETQFERATKEGDHDFAAFGQTVLQVSLNSEASGLLYRCWHLRDCAWIENADGAADTIYRRWKPKACELKALFKNKVHRDVDTAMEKERYKEFNVMHCIIPTEAYKGDLKYTTPYVSIYFDVDHKHIMEEVGLKAQEYLIPRWSTVSGSQYAYSPATITALPDARLIQSMTRVLLDAGEKAVTPPLIAVQEALRSDVFTHAGGITWVAQDYDERLGEVLRPLTQDMRGLPTGINMSDRIANVIHEAFYLNKLSLPPAANEMTAYEVGQRVQEYIRQAMPLFTPMETEYNSPLCDATFTLMLRRGAFGSLDSIPASLHGEDIEFQFESPLHDAVEREKGQRFMEAQAMLADAAAIDPSVVDVVDISIAFREVLQSIGVPAKWTRTEEEVKKIADDRMQRQQTAELLANMQQGADVAKTLGEATTHPGGAQAAQQVAQAVSPM